MNVRYLVVVGLFVTFGWTGCSEQKAEEESSFQPSKLSLGKSDASAEAIFVNFEFDGEVTFDACYNEEKRIEKQLLYTVGQLNGERGVGRIDTLELTDIETSYTPEQGCLATYHARLLVAWGLEHTGKTDYELVLPKDVRHEAVEYLFEHHGKSCSKAFAKVDTGSMWYYWRPKRTTCAVDESLIIRVPVEVSDSPVHTTGKYPEYHKIWEDGVLKVVTIFGKVEDGGDASDVGVKEYNSYVQSLRSLMKDWDVETEPAEVPFEPGNDLPDVTVKGTMPDGRKVEVVALLVDDIKYASNGFYNRYEELTRKVDLLSYNGHSGLGANIRTIAGKGEWTQGQYSIVFMNGCDTYAYVDSALADAHAAVNPDDPEGTKYLDILMNAMPSYFYTMADSGMTLVNALIDIENPKTYEQIFDGIDREEMVIVSGEHDNEFVPGMGQSEPSPEIVENGWSGMLETGSIEQWEEQFFSTPVLEPGKYQFILSGGGDIDLHVRIGEAPSQSLYDCRPFSLGSNEVCEVELNVPTAVYVMLLGWSQPADFALEGLSIQE